MTASANTVAPKRRALGDVLNTAISNRPAVGLTPHKAGLKQVLATTNTPAKLQATAPRCAEPATKELPPVERCIPAPADTFDDVFEDNLRLTDLFLSSKQQIKFIGRLPGTQSVYLEDKMRDLDVTESDKETRRQLKRRNRALKKQLEQVDVDAIRIFPGTELLKDLSPVRELELNDSDWEKL